METTGSRPAPWKIEQIWQEMMDAPPEKFLEVFRAGLRELGFTHEEIIAILMGEG